MEHGLIRRGSFGKNGRFQRGAVFGGDNPTGRIGEQAADQLRAYLSGYDDEGNGYGRLAEALIAIGETVDAKVALREGIDAAKRFGHPGMANELSARLDELEEG